MLLMVPLVVLGVVGVGWVAEAGETPAGPAPDGRGVLAAAAPPDEAAAERTGARAGTRSAGRVRARPFVIAHRGASARMPEHTLIAYRTAFLLGADSIEVDLVPSRDGVLVARHEPTLSASTDVASRPEFAGHRRTRHLAGEKVTDWFVDDFTVAELRRLRTVERSPQRRPTVASQDGTYGVPTFQEVLDLLRAEQRPLGRRLSLVVEVKRRGFFGDAGFDVEELLAEQLRANGLHTRRSPVTVASFSAASLRETRKLADVPTCYLTSADDDIDIKAISRYADALAVDMTHMRDILAGQRGRAGEAPLVARAHRHGMRLYAHTLSRDRVGDDLPEYAFRDTDPAPLAAALAEYRAYYGLGVDGVFTDDPELARRAVGD